jgi:hypothetical protein
MERAGTPAGSLVPPPGVTVDDRVFEVVRIWVVGDHQEFVIRPRVWKDPAAWGLLLADLTRHIAQAIEEHEGKELRTVIDRIKEGFDAEMSTPTTDKPLM